MEQKSKINEYTKAILRNLDKHKKATKKLPKTILSIRIDSDLKELIEYIAIREDRTVSNQAVRLLKNAVEQYIREHELVVDPATNVLGYPSRPEDISLDDIDDPLSREEPDDVEEDLDS